MNLTEKIAALPKEPDPEDYCCPAVDKRMEAIQYHVAMQDHLLVRLALAREWIEGAHRNDCNALDSWGPRLCDCGRDALLKALK